MLRLFLFFFCLLIQTGSGYATVWIDSDIDNPVDIGKQQTNQWRFKAEDNLDFKLPQHDDTDWQIIKSFPHNWRDPSQPNPSKSNIAWYRLHLRFNPDTKPKSQTLKLGPLNDIDETFFNGKLIGSTGSIESELIDPEGHSYDKVRLYHIPFNLIKPSSDNVISIRVRSFFPDEGGFRTPDATVTIGPADEVRNSFITGEMISLVLIFLFIASAFYFALRAFQSGYLATFFLISSACLAFSLYIFVNSQLKYIFFQKHILFKRIEYILVSILIYIMMDFYYLYFLAKNRDNPSWIYRGGQALVIGLNFIAIVSVIFLLLTNDLILWDWVFMNVFRPLWVLPITLSLWILVGNIKQKTPNALIVLPFYLLCIVAVVNDVLFDLAFISWGEIGHITFLLMVVVLAGLEITRPLHKHFDNDTIEEDFVKEISKSTKEKIDSALIYLNRNFTTPITREALADKLDISPDHFGRSFKQQTGFTLKDYLNDLRIKEAEVQLKKSDISVVDIAYNVGFESLRTFNRAFKKKTGESPSTYRKQQSEQKSN